MNNVVILDKTYSADKIAEGRAIQWAIFSGTCDKCEHLGQCSNDKSFVFPQNAPCMKKKSEFLKERENHD